MATITGSVQSGSFAQYYTFYIDYSVSQNVAGNYSVVTANTYMRKDKTSQTAYGNNKSASLSVEGTSRSITFSYDFRNSSLKLVQSESYTVYHNADGTKSVYIGASANFGTSLLGAASAGATVALPTIPRASGISADAATAGGHMTVRMGAASISFTHKAVVSLGGNTTSRDFGAGVSSGSIAIPASWAAVMPSATSGIATVTLYTYSGGTHIGTTTTNAMIYVGSGVVPTFSKLALEDVGEVPDSWGLFVRSKSKLKLDIQSPTGVYGSTITNYSITGGGFSGTGQSLTTGFLPSAGEVAFSAYIKDSRGRTSATKNKTITVVDYEAPAITKKIVTRCNAQGIADEEGTYLRCQLEFGFSEVLGKNTASATVQYRRVGSSTWSNAGSIISGQAKVIGGGGIQNTASYEVLFAVNDAFTTTLATEDVATSMRLMNVRAESDGIAFGKFAEQAGVEIAEDWPFIPHGVRQIFPVGAIYMSVDATNPAAYFGGTWQRFSKGKVLIGVDEEQGEFNSIGKTGGDKYLSGDLGIAGVNYGGIGNAYYAGRVLVTSTLVNNAGTMYNSLRNINSTAANNLPPYVTCYIWQRTA